MADATTKTTPSKETLLKHLKDVTDKTMALVGSNKFNPYMWVKRNVESLSNELNAIKEGSVPEALAAKVLALKPAELPK